ncbi:ABC transporter permease [Ponticoccus alexandrii]|uniref:ABC transporter permease subunit n=1 Tax=Ponticoccus alexandrii TaxID=1943633 RepID=A0ABX7FBN7_9RHOB|nr:iron ABC transporter permease [Ponticoccus alexandrii]ETA53831.1 iron ABC transporter permease [Rhodobacteraceae bacterium PD-2]QRF67276.1 ABC transporter permease subunit [Ponticoccus alexandrii]
MQTVASTEAKGLHLPSRWSLGAALIALIVVAPIVAVFGFAMFPKENIWPHLISTTLPRYMKNTVVLMTGVGFLTMMVGTGAAWLVSRYDFPGRRWLEYLLLLPLGIPAYIGAYALVDFLEYAGPVQTALRELFGWTSARDYWFPEIRSMGAAILVLSAALYPYVYLLSRNAFREQSAASEEVAQSLGAGAWGRFWRVGAPLARPAVAAGVAIVMMESVNDFGTVDYFAVQTLTTGIFSVWLQANNAGGAAQIACVVLVLVVMLVMLEKASRRRMRFFNLSTRHRPVARKRLTGGAGMLATFACFLPFAMGFILPAGVILSHAIDNAETWTDPALWRAGLNTLTVGSLAAVIAVAAGVFLVYGVRLSGRRLPRLLLPVTTIGYAAPGAVLGIGILIPLAAIDHRIADAILAVTGYDPGLMLTGTAFALVLAYCVRFFAIAQGAADAAMGRVSPNLALAARSLGRNEGQVLGAVYVPLMRASVLSAVLLVFVDCVKELPATLLLRPFNYETLATRTHDQAALENLGEAAPAAMLVIAVGLLAVGLLARANR